MMNPFLFYTDDIDDHPLQQLVFFTDTTVEVLDIRTLKTIESDSFLASNLISPTLSYTMSGAIAYHDSIRDIQHSVRTYKGKIFALVRIENKFFTHRLKGMVFLLGIQRY